MACLTHIAGGRSRTSAYVRPIEGAAITESEDEAPRCLVCDVELEVPAGGGRAPRFCSGAHRAKFNRKEAQQLLPRHDTPAAVAPALVTDFEDTLRSTAAAGRRLVDALAASQTVAARLEEALARAALAGADRDAARAAHREAAAQLTSLQAAVDALRSQLSVEEQLREQITADRDRLAAQTP